LLRGPRQALHRRIAEALEQRFPDLVETRPEIVAHHYGEAVVTDKAITYWHLAGKSSVARSAAHEATAQLRRGLGLLDGLPETRERKQLELDIHVTLVAALMAGRGFANPEVVAALERANRLVAETAAVGTPLHFSVLYGLWVSNHVGGAIAAALERATNFLSSAQSQHSSGPLLMGHRILAHCLIYSGDYRAALAHIQTAASLHRPDEHCDSAFRYGQDIGVSALPSCPGRFGIAAILISLPELPVVRSHIAVNWDMPPPLPMHSGMPAWPRSSPEMSPPPARTITIARRSRVNTGSPYGRPLAGFFGAGSTPKKVKRRRELPASATV
jgi:hypothetical protein